MSTVRQRIEQAGFRLPSPPTPNGKYHAVTLSGGFVFASGQLCRDGDEVVKGPIDGMCEQEIIHAARLSVLRGLSAIENAVGSLDYLQSIVRMTGFVYATENFTAHSSVLDHASDLLRIAFLDEGAHARTAIGVSSLPSGGCIEIELTAALRRSR